MSAISQTQIADIKNSRLLFEFDHAQSSALGKVTVECNIFGVDLQVSSRTLAVVFVHSGGVKAAVVSREA